ncbi:YcxB family protein [Algibacter sp. AS12]|uniref:YcxB family protein n=1 Tax=Algibacter sp. AS12 TaxID=3135773 RepID=UPI00398AC64D
MIETKAFSLTKENYYKIVLLTRFKKSWWLYLIMILIAIFNLPKFGNDSFSTFFIIFSFSYPFIISIYLYFWTSLKGHKPIFSKTHLSFNNEYLHFKRAGNESKLVANSIQKAVSKNNYWLIYIAKSQFIYVPKNIFHNVNDLEAFSKLIKQNL